MGTMKLTVLLLGSALTLCAQGSTAITVTPNASESAYSITNNTQRYIQAVEFIWQQPNGIPVQRPAYPISLGPNQTVSGLGPLPLQPVTAYVDAVMFANGEIDGPNQWGLELLVQSIDDYYAGLPVVVNPTQDVGNFADMIVATLGNDSNRPLITTDVQSKTVCTILNPWTALAYGGYGIQIPTLIPPTLDQYGNQQQKISLSSPGEFFGAAQGACANPNVCVPLKISVGVQIGVSSQCFNPPVFLGGDEYLQYTTYSYGTRATSAIGSVIVSGPGVYGGYIETDSCMLKAPTITGPGGMGPPSYGGPCPQ